MKSTRHLAPLLCCTLALFLAACATDRPTPDPDMTSRIPAPEKPASDSTPGGRGAVSNVNATDPLPEASRIYNGTGQFVKGQLPGGGLPPPANPAVASTGAVVTLNFEAADLRDVIRNILGDILGESYTIEPAVGGTVTIRTSAGVPREALIGTLEMLLRMNSAATSGKDRSGKSCPRRSCRRAT